MSYSAYHFVTTWIVQRSADVVYTILSNPADLVRWWPSISLEVERLE